MDEQRETHPAVPLRASDADRESVARLLHDAAADGRLSMSEMEDRLKSAYRARTLTELQPLTRDLAPAAPVPPRVRTPAPGTPVSERVWVTMSSSKRVGQWVVPARFAVGALMGSVKLDLREAILTEPDFTINVTVVMGNVEIIVPDDLDAIVVGTGVMGTFESKAPQVVAASRGSVRVDGFALMGSVEVRPASKRERRRARGH